MFAVKVVSSNLTPPYSPAIRSILPSSAAPIPRRQWDLETANEIFIQCRLACEAEPGCSEDAHRGGAFLCQGNDRIPGALEELPLRSDRRDAFTRLEEEMVRLGLEGLAEAEQRLCACRGGLSNAYMMQPGRGRGGVVKEARNADGSRNRWKLAIRPATCLKAGIHNT